MSQLMQRVPIYVLFLAAVSGCSTITPLGPDTYLMEGGTAVTATRAEELCAKTGKKVLVTNLTSGNKFIFKCLDPNSPEYVAPTFRSAPNAVIEDRRSK
jgi:hypothetical protein